MKQAPTGHKASSTGSRASRDPAARTRFAEPLGPRDDAVEAQARQVAQTVARGGSSRSLPGAPGDAADWAPAGWRPRREGVTIRRAVKDEAPPQPAATPVAAAAGPATTSPGGATPALRGELLADDDGALRDGQMRKSDFLAALRRAVCAAVDDGLAGTGRDSQGCPWIDHWLDHYAGRTASQVEASLRRYAPEARGAASVAAYIDAVTARVRRSAGGWAATGQVTGLPPDIPDSPMAGGALLNGFGGMFFKGRPGGAQASRPAASVQDELGQGRPLPATVRARMEPAFGTSFADVQLHDDAAGGRLSDDFNARAFTVGRHVAFGAGEFRPGTPGGDALIAHELAHVAQQADARPAGARTTPSRRQDTGPLEADADRSAAAFVRQGWLGARTAAHDVAPRMKSGLTLARCSKERPGVAQGKDLHAGAKMLDATAQQDVQRELHPGAAGSGAALAQWDAASAAPGSAVQKTALKNDLKAKVTAAMLASLNAEMPGINAISGTARVPIADLEGPGNAAKTVVDRRFKEWISVAALTPSQASLRHAFAFRASGAGKNLFDANDPGQRSAAGLPVDPHDLAGWIAETAGSGAMAPHKFSPTRGGEEQAFLESEIIVPFVAAHEADLKQFDLFGFAITDPATHKIVIGTATDPNLGAAPGSGGAPSPAQRSLRWGAWETLVHEYIHTLEHPGFHSAGGNNNRIMSEGFCTMFSEEVLLDQIPKAPKDASLRKDIEGGSFPEPPAGTVPPFAAGSYADFLAHATAIRARVGDNAVKAAFFQGHVEFLGLDPSGGTTAPVAAAASDVLAVPAGITTVAQLAKAANVAVADISAANPGLTASTVVSGTLHLPGAREHVVVEAGPGGSETRAQIAKQNGITESALSQANPAAPWGSLAAGMRLLIPRR